MTVAVGARATRMIRAHEGATAALLGVLLAAIAVLRIPRADAGVIWAEGARVFLTRRLETAPGAVWFEPYDGYLHLLPRVLADAAVTLLPLEAYAVAVTVACCVVAGAVGALVYVCARDVVVWLPARFGLAAVVVLLPTAGFEVLGDLANSHALLLWLTPWLLLVRPRSRVSAVLFGVVGLVVGFSEIQAAFAVPFLFYRVRDRFGWPVRAGLALGLLAQVLVALSGTRAERGVPWPDPLSQLEGFAANVLLMPWIGQGLTGRVMGIAPVFLAVLAVLLFALVLGYLLWRGSTAERVAAALLGWGAVTVWLAGFTLNPNPEYFFAQYDAARWASVGALRYGIVPAMFVTALVLLAAAVLVRRRGRPGWRGSGAVGVALLIVLVLLAGWRVAASTSTIRSGGPEWAAGLGSARAVCAVEAPPVSVEIPVHPAGWAAIVPCALLRE